MNFITELYSAKKEMKGCYWKALGIGVLFSLVMLASCVTVVGPLIIYGPMFLGLHRAILQLVRTKNVKVSTLFSGFKDFGVAFRVAWLSGIKIFLWSLLLIVPGIIALARYSMAFFILSDNPNMTAREAINKSKEMIEGKKWEFFKNFALYFGFFCLINIISSIFSTENYSNEMFFVSYILSAVALVYSIFVVPLWNLMLPKKFYNEKLIKKQNLEITKDIEQTRNVGKFIGIFLLYCLLMVVLVITIVGAVFMAAPLTLGFSKVILDYSRDNEVKVSTLFSGFKNYKRAFCLGLLMFLKVFLWSLLLIVPGFVAAIKYSMSYFILADNPEIKASEAIEKSKEMMNGRKMDFVMYYIEYFLLFDISRGISNFIFKFAKNREILFLYVISAVIFIGTLIYYLIISPDYTSILVERFYKDLFKDDCLENKNIEAK